MRQLVQPRGVHQLRRRLGRYERLVEGARERALPHRECTEERLHEHFRVTQRECDALLERHVAALRAQVQSQLDPKPVRARMRAEGSEADGSGGWRELKVLGFARAVGSVYVLALLALRLRVRLNIVARHYLAEREASGGVLAGPEKRHARELVREQRGRPREHGRLGRRPTVARAR